MLDGMRSHVIDGLIFSPLALTADEIADRADDLPMVLLGERAVPAGFDHVAVDSVAAAQAVTEHLISLGRRRIAAIGRESVEGTASVRLAGISASAASRRASRYDPDLVVGVARYERADGEAAMESLLALPEPPDAVFCFNDLMAVGALRACAEAGVAVPDDVAVAGFDNIAEGAVPHPTLTTIAADLDVLSHEALRLLLLRVGGDMSAAVSVKVPWTLRVRESTRSGRDLVRGRAAGRGRSGQLGDDLVQGLAGGGLEQRDRDEAVDGVGIEHRAHLDAGRGAERRRSAGRRRGAGPGRRR